MEQIRIFEVKEFNLSDIQVINRLLDQLTSSPVRFEEADLKEMIASENCHLFLLTCEEEVAGMLSIGSYRTPGGEKYWIEDVVVDRRFRGKAFGRKLIEYAIQYVNRQGESTLMLTSNPARIAANRLYQSVGFELKPTNVYKMSIRKQR